MSIYFVVKLTDVMTEVSTRENGLQNLRWMSVCECANYFNHLHHYLLDLLPCDVAIKCFAYH